MKDFTRILSNLVNEECGQDLIEYALVMCMIALGATAAISGLAGTIRTALGTVGAKLTNFV
jgi:pilus assembly protein Flp/PilA